MIRRIANLWYRRKTRNLTKIPIFYMIFDYQKYKRDGKSGSCTFYAAHPDIASDDFIKKRLQEVVDYVRDNYDLDEIARI